MIACLTLYTADTLRIDYRHDTENRRKKIAFVFSALGNRILDGDISGGNMLLENGFDVVRFSSTANDWFQKTPHFIFAELDRIACAAGYERRVALGSSMGGYAAICFSNALHCDIVLAYSPQYSVTDWFDGRFEPATKGIVWRHCISADSIGEKCAYWLVYDNKDFDAVHAAHLRALIGEARYHEIALSHVGHATVFYLYELGLLRQTTLSVLKGEPVSARALLRDRKRSLQYLFTLSGRLSAKHPTLASRIKKLAGDLYEPPWPLRWAIDKKVFILSWLAVKIEIQRLRRRNFDEKFYRHVNWDIEVNGGDPLTHYASMGRREGRLVRFHS